METSIEDVCCLEIPEICKPRFSSTWCLYVCRLESHFAQLYSSRENFISYLNSTQCWSLANQNKSFLSLQTLQLSFSVKYFTILIRSFFLYKMFFLWAYFLKRTFNSIRGSVIIEKQYLIARIAVSDSQELKNLLNGAKMYEIHFLGI